MPIRVFIASDPTDRSLLDEFLAQLGNLIRQETITVWCDDTMLAGSDQEQERMMQLNEAQLILLLVSARFIAAEPYPHLLQRALARNHTEQTPVIPILLRPEKKSLPCRRQKSKKAARKDSDGLEHLAASNRNVPREGISVDQFVVHRFSTSC